MRWLFSLTLIYAGLTSLPAQAQHTDRPYRIYFAIESGWQDVEYKKIRSMSASLLTGQLGLSGEADVRDITGPKGDGAFTASGGLGAEWRSPLFQFLFLSPALHIGGEISIGYSSFRGEADNVFPVLGVVVPQQPLADGSAITDTVRIAESLALHVAADLGLYIFQNLLLFSRFGYAYIESERDVVSIRRSNTQTLNDIDYVDERRRYGRMGTIGSNAFIAGVGLRYKLTENFGARFYYLNHIGRREAQDIRLGLVWWIF